MNKKGKVFKRVVIGVIVAAVIAAGVLYALGVFGGNEAASTTSYQISGLETGDLQKSVSGSGTLSQGDTKNVSAPFAVTVGDIAVTAGQSVKKGDALASVDAESVDAAIADLQTEIESLDSQLARLLKEEDADIKVKSPMKGRVKKIMAQEGDNVKNVVEQSGGLLILSTDDKMRLDIALKEAGAVAAGDEVTVETGGEEYDGEVESVSDDQSACTVTLTDDGPEPDASAEVFLDDKSIGEGTLAINQPVTVTATAGIVYKVRVYENKRVYQNTTLFYLQNVPYSESYTSAARQRAELAEQLKTAMQIKKTGVIAADEDGIVNEITAVEGQALETDEVLLSLLTGGASTLTVNVDELDIAQVQVGQKVTVSMDAVTDKTYEGEVVSISQLGTTSNGVTTYPVRVNVKDDGNLKIGMSATATIVVEEHTGVLLLPLEALQSSRGEQYVWLYTGTLPKDANEDPGKRTVVEVGLSNDSYVEVTSGLTTGDQVVIVRTRSADNGDSNNRGNNNMQLFGGDMPGGGMPQGEFRGRN